MVAVLWSRYSDHVFVIVLFALVFGWVVVVNSIYERDVVFAINIDRSTAELESVRSSDGIFIGQRKKSGKRPSVRLKHLEREELATLFNTAPEPIKLLIGQRGQYNLTKDVTIITATKGRLDAVHRLVKSIAESGYGDLRIIIVNDRDPDNDTYKWHEDKIMSYKNAQYHIVKAPSREKKFGIGRSRNLALSLVTTPFFLLLDDNHIITNQSKLEVLYQVLTTTDTAIAGGYRLGSPEFPSFMRFDLGNNTMFMVTRCLNMDTNTELPQIINGDCRQVDLLPNFFMGRTSAVKLAGGWDSRQPYNELSEEFFIKAKRANLKVVKCNVHVEHQKIKYPSSERHIKLKKKRYHYRFLKKFNIFYKTHCSCSNLVKSKEGKFICDNKRWRHAEKHKDRLAVVNIDNERY
ncbi:hypothetical protein ACHWQZ_G016469 [Mnemiopsis leidyi]